MGFGTPPGLSNPSEKKVEFAHITHGTVGTATNTIHGANNSVADLNNNTFMLWDDENSGLDSFMDFDLLEDPKTDARNGFLGRGTPSVNSFLSRDDTNSRSGGGYVDFDFLDDPIMDATNAFVGRSTSTLSPVRSYTSQDVSLPRSNHNIDALNSNFSTLNRLDANNPLLGVMRTSSNASRIQNTAGENITDRATLNPSPAHGRSRFRAEGVNLQSGHFPSSSSYRHTPATYPEHVNSSVSPAYSAGQSNLNQRHNFSGQHGSSFVPFSAGVSSNSVYDWRMGMPSVNPRLGQPYHSRHNVGSPAASQISVFPPNFSFPVAQGNTFQSTVGGTFHNRISFHPNHYATARPPQGPPPVPLAAPVNHFRPSLAAGQQQHGIHFRPSLAAGQQQHGIHFRPSLAAGQQQHGIMPPFPMIQRVAPIPSVPRLNIGGSQASPRLNHQSLKRPATENAHISTSSQRRRVIPQPFPYPQPRPRQSQHTRAPARATTPISPASFHIKCQEGFDKLRPPSGQKCGLCKRDVSFTSEGQLSQPITPPAVAVLPCGHVFHDECLQRITPADQSKNPPCIPCAIGET